MYNEKTRIHGNGSVGICVNPSKKNSVYTGIFVCDTQDVCDLCDVYECKHTEDSVTNDFNQILRDPSVCGQEYPKLAILLWVLEGDIRGKDGLFKRMGLFFKRMFKC